MYMAATCKYVHDYGYRVYDTMLHHFWEGYTVSGSLCGTLWAKPEVFPKEIHFLYSFLEVRTVNNAECPDYHLADLLEAN